MKVRKLLGYGSAIGLAVCAFWWHRDTTNPYKADGLQVRWAYSEEPSAVPTLDVWVDHDGRSIEPDIQFGGIIDPSLRYSDYDGDGTRDIVFGDRNTKQVVSFKPATATAPPSFTTLRNDVTWAHQYAPPPSVAAGKYDWFSIGNELGKNFDVPVQSAFEQSGDRVHVTLTITSEKLAKGDLKDRQTLAPKLNEFFWKNYGDTGRVAELEVVFVHDGGKPTSDAYAYSPPKKQ